MVIETSGIISWREISLEILKGFMLKKRFIEIFTENSPIEDEKVCTDVRIDDVSLYGPYYYHVNKSSQIYVSFATYCAGSSA